MSDENSQSSEAPDGAGEGQGLDPNEVMTRAEARKLVAQRQELKARNEELAASHAEQAKQLEALRSQLEGRQGDVAGPPDAPDMPSWAKTLVDQNRALAEEVKATKAMFGEHRLSSARDAVEKEVLAKVPDGNRSTVKALLGSMNVDFTQPGAAADALAKLQEHHPITMVDHSRGVQLRAPQISPDGKVPASYFESFKSFSEVPDAYKQAAMRDPEVFKRLTAGGGGEGHPLSPRR
jgi:hypothetical protein